MPVQENAPHPRMLGLRLALAFLLTALTTCVGETWQTNDWPSGSPESQGLDSGVLADLLDHVRTQNLPIHSLLVIRHGKAVLDASFYPYDRARPHDVASVTKSITSLLVGIAIDKGYLKGVGEPVLSLLPHAAPSPGSRIRNLTVEHLLTMTSGLDCGVQPGERELAAMRRSRDWAAFALALPILVEPGTQFAYCSCNNHLLSAILSARTGASAADFGRKHLFSPLGIKDLVWPADPLGLYAWMG